MSFLYVFIYDRSKNNRLRKGYAASVQDVEECVADVFIYLWQYPEKYDPDREKLSSWLSVVARSKVVDRYRRIIKTREIPLENIVAGRMEYAAITADGPDEEKEKLRSCIEEKCQSAGF